MKVCPEIHIQYHPGIKNLVYVSRIRFHPVYIDFRLPHKKGKPKWIKKIVNAIKAGL